MSLKQLLFVAMPFGQKPDSSGRYDIDFDAIYALVIRVAADAAGVDALRADQELFGGPIHLAMYERLLLAEIVLADLTLSNPNVFYEVGVRHAARPRSTILMYAKGSRLPFDLSPMRAIPYELEDGKLPDDSIAPLIAILKESIERAKSDPEHVDSPLFQLLPGLQPPVLPEAVAETFRDHLNAVATIRRQIQAAAREGSGVGAVKKLSALEEDLRPLVGRPPDLLSDLMRAYRTVRAWDNMIRCIERFPPSLRDSVVVQQQLALALNRRNGSGDRRRAIGILQALRQRQEASAETYGILGRVYKDMYLEHSDKGRDVEAAAALDEAIRYYVAGFEEDPRDYYPGINALTLSLLQGGDEARVRVDELRPVVEFAVARRRGIASIDYWDVAAAFELAAITQDWPTAKRAAGRLCMLAQEVWMLETTINNSALIRRWLAAGKGSVDRLDHVVTLLERRASEVAGSGQ